MSVEQSDLAELKADYQEAVRWGYPGTPLPTFRQWRIEREAQEVHFERTGRADPWPSMDDYAEAARRVDGES